MRNRRLLLIAGVLVGLVLIRQVLRSPTSPGPEPLAGPPPEVPRTAAPPSAQPEDDAAAPPTGAPGAPEEAIIALLGEDPTRDIERQLASWDEQGIIHATCRLDPAPDQARGYLAIGGHSDLNGRVVLVLGGVAHLPILTDHPTEGLLSIEGYAPAPVSWSLPGEDGSPGRCRSEPVQLTAGGAVVTGTVTLAGSGDPDPEAWVEGCGNLGRTDDEGVYYLEAVAAPCTLIAMRQDGALRSMSAPVAVTPAAGEDTVVDLVLPAHRRAGLGVMIRAVEEGVLIEQLIDGGSAAEAGLLEGDLITAVEGDPVSEMDLGEFVERVGGAPGTTVTLTVADRGEILVERVELPSAE